MKLDSLKDLEKLMRLCRKEGVKVFELDNIRFELHDSLPQKNKRSKSSHTQTDIANSEYDAFGAPPVPYPFQENPAPDVIKHDGPTEEQLLFGSSDPSVWENKQ